MFPAMLKAHGEYILPDNVPANEFLNLEGEKISTSRNWAVWLHEYLEEFPGKQDVLRYVLTANAPEAKDNDFTWKDFQTRNNNELVAVLGNFVNRTLVLTQKYYDGKCPAISTLTDYDTTVLGEISAIKTRVQQSLEAFRIREALNEAMSLARLGNKYLAETEPWKLYTTDPVRVATILHVSLQITANLTILMDSFLPFTMKQLRGYLNIGEMPWSAIGSVDLIKSGHQMEKPGLLFDKIEDSQMDFQVNKLLETKKANEAKASGLAESKPIISYDDFSAMDIRIATILEAEKVPKTQKLMKLKVDTGIDVRTVVSGIAEHFEAQALIGKQITLLANLEPRMIKGIESKGMILLAEDNLGRLIFVKPEDAIQNGAVVK
jgi:methionyl-tRNA synthetase